MSKHQKEKRKLYWWQRKRLIQMQFQAWLLRWQEFKFELKEVYIELKKMNNKGEK